jgi:hypothetical protein
MFQKHIALKEEDPFAVLRRYNPVDSQYYNLQDESLLNQRS